MAMNGGIPQGNRGSMNWNGLPAVRQRHEVPFPGYAPPSRSGVPRPERPLDLRDYLKILLRQKWILVLGFFLGAINGFLVWGTMWWFLDDAAYPFEIISAPDEATVVGQEAIRLVRMLPPVWLMAETGTPIIYFAVAIAFVFQS